MSYTVPRAPATPPVRLVQLNESPADADTALVTARAPAPATRAASAVSFSRRCGRYDDDMTSSSYESDDSGVTAPSTNQTPRAGLSGEGPSARYAALKGRLSAPEHDP